MINEKLPILISKFLLQNRIEVKKKFKMKERGSCN